MRPKGSAAELSKRRRHALRLLDQGLSFHEVARRIECHPSSVMRWRDTRRRRGERVYEVGASPGRPPKLSPRDQRRLIRWLSLGALAQGYSTDLWTCARVGELIGLKFGVDYHRDHVGRLLHRLEWSYQKPQRRAIERDEEAIERWKRKDWPRIKRKPRGWGPTSSSSTKRAPC
jgi:transposase